MVPYSQNLKYLKLPLPDSSYLELWNVIERVYGKSRFCRKVRKPINIALNHQPLFFFKELLNISWSVMRGSFTSSIVPIFLFFIIYRIWDEPVKVNSQAPKELCSLHANFDGFRCLPTLSFKISSSRLFSPDASDTSWLRCPGRWGRKDSGISWVKLMKSNKYNNFTELLFDTSFLPWKIITFLTQYHFRHRFLRICNYSSSNGVRTQRYSLLRRNAPGSTIWWACVHPQVGFQGPALPCPRWLHSFVAFALDTPHPLSADFGYRWGRYLILSS